MSNLDNNDYLSESGGGQPPESGAEPPLQNAPSGPPAGQEPLPSAGPVLTSGTRYPRAATAQSSTSDDRLMAALAWLSLAILQIPLISVVLLLAEGNRDRAFQRYHSLMSIGFWIAAIIYEVFAAIVYTIVGIATLGCGLVCLFPIFFLPHIVALYYAYEAYMGRQPVIPVITEVMQRQGWS